MRCMLLLQKELAPTHGCMPDGEAVMSLQWAKLGGREMTAASDLDLIVVYDFAEGATQSDGGAPTGRQANITPDTRNA